MVVGVGMRMQAGFIERLVVRRYTERRRNWERGESLRARCSAQIFRLLKSREMSACNSH